LTKTGTGTVYLNAANTYSGGTTISSGTVALGVNGSIANSSVIMVNSGATFDVQALSNANFTLGASQTLKGDGTVLGPTINNGTVAPGVSIGTLTFATPPTLNGTTLIELNRTNAQTCDRLQVSSGTLAYGGKLTVTNVGPFVQTGDSFQLFSASGYAGSFSTTNLPSLPGLVWNFNASSGLLTVVQAVATNPTNITCATSNGSLTLSWPTDHIGWRLQAQTNSPNTGLGTNWVDVPASSSTNSVTMPLDANNGSVFYRMVYP
jgi:autotransporter-associated beta strand protein